MDTWAINNLQKIFCPAKILWLYVTATAYCSTVCVYSEVPAKARSVQKLSVVGSGASFGVGGSFLRLENRPTVQLVHDEAPLTYIARNSTAVPRE